MSAPADNQHPSARNPVRRAPRPVPKNGSPTHPRAHPDNRSASGNPTVPHRHTTNGNGMHPEPCMLHSPTKPPSGFPAVHSDRTPGPRNSQPNAAPFATPHIPGSYRLRRHFPRYCDVTTRVRHPYQLRILLADTRHLQDLRPKTPFIAPQARTLRTTELHHARSGPPPPAPVLRKTTNLPS